MLTPNNFYEVPNFKVCMSNKSSKNANIYLNLFEYIIVYGLSVIVRAQNFKLDMNVTFETQMLAHKHLKKLIFKRLKWSENGLKLRLHWKHWTVFKICFILIRQVAPDWYSASFIFMQRSSKCWKLFKATVSLNKLRLEIWNYIWCVPLIFKIFDKSCFKTINY